MTADPVRVVYTKYDGSLHWHQTMFRLGEDEHGTWLGAPPGIIARKGADGPPVKVRQAHVMLFPRDTWWTAVFNDPPADLEIYCDITTPPTWPEPGQVTMVDLDLDVGRVRADGRTELYDEDEFEEHQRRYAYPADVIAEATASARWLHQAVSERMEPFGSAYVRWLSLLANADRASA